MNIKEIRLLINSLKFQKKSIILVFFLTILFTVFEGISVGLLLPVIQVASEGNIGLLRDRGGYWRVLDSIFKTLRLPLTLVTLLLAILLGVIIKQVVGYFQLLYTKKIQHGYIAHLRSYAFDKIIKADINYFNNKRIGDIVNTLSVQTQNSGGLLFLIVELITKFFLISVYIFLLIMISWQMTLLTVFVFIALSLSVQRQISFSRGYGKVYVKLHDEFHDFITQNLAGIRVLKNAAVEDREARKLDAIVKRISINRIKSEISKGKITFIFEPFMVAIVLFIFYFGVQLLQMQLASLAVFFYILLRLSPQVILINRERHGLADFMGAQENVEKTLLEVEAMTKIKGGTQVFKGIGTGIEIKNLSFNYVDQPVLKDINFSIRKNEMVAIVGASGAGKSTLVDLFLRFHDPRTGQILIDGMDIKEFDMRSFRRKIGYVSQDTFLFNDTVIANIGYGRDSLSQDTIIEASKIARAHDFIVKLPKGYKTIIGERGVKLSGGQKQRLALARAIVGRPEILILDEATSHLDSESERLIQESLNKIRQKYTIITIAHRLSTIEHANKIIVLKDGQIIEEGTHEKLLKLKGDYAKYYAIQTNDSDKEKMR